MKTYQGLIQMSLLFSAISANASSVVRVDPSTVVFPGLSGNLDAFRAGIAIGLDQCKRFSKTKTWDLGDRKATTKEWCTKTYEKMIELAAEAKDFPELWEKAKLQFHWYQSKGDDLGTVHYTGYYLPRLKAKRVPDAEYRYPIYSRPPELVQATISGKTKWGFYNSQGEFGPFFTRYEIDWVGMLSGRGLEIAYTNDFIKLFFVHIQGSGAVEVLDEENRIKENVFVNYDSQNGHSYIPIGRILREEGVDSSQLTMQGIVKFFQENPYEVDRLIPLNPSFIFFREQLDGPFGAIATKLIPEHSVALDPTHYPLGSLAIISTESAQITEGEPVGFQPFSRFVMGQDVGGAIQGAGRVDIYFGHGELAEPVAGVQNHRGHMYFPVIPNAL